jgi:hypothetical protein
VAADLKPVLHAFQRAGLTIFAASSRSGQGPMSMTLRAPSIVARAVEWMYRVTVSKGDEEAFGRTVAHVG